MPAGRRDLERAARPLLAAHVGEVEVAAPRAGVRSRATQGSRLALAAQVRDRLGEVPHRNRLDPGERRLGRRLGGAEDPRKPGPPRALGQRRARRRPAAGARRARARRRPRAPRASARNLARGREHRERDRQVEARALLPQPRGREVDRDPPQRPLELGRGDPAPDAVLRLLAGAVGEPDDREPRQAALEVRLDLDAAGVEADERVGDGAREHPTHARVPMLTCL